MENPRFVRRNVLPPGDGGNLLPAASPDGQRSGTSNNFIGLWNWICRALTVRLARRVSLLVFITTVPALLAGILFLARMSADKLQADAYRQLEGIADDLNDHTNAWINCVDQELRCLSHHAELVSLQRDRMTAALRSIQSANPDLISYAMVVGTDGTCLAHSLKVPVLHYQDRDWFKGAIAGRPVTRQLVLSRSIGKMSLIQAGPVYDSSGKIVAVIAVGLDLGQISKAVGAGRYGKSGYTLLVDEKGTALAHFDIQQTQASTNYANLPPVAAEIKDHEERSFRYADAEGHYWLAYAIPLQLGWSAISFQREDEALSEVRQILNWGFAIIGICSAIMIGTIGIGSRWAMSPLEKMTHVAREISAGDWNSRMRVNRNDELGQLSAAFDTMMDRLVATYRLIEQKVADRTAALSNLNIALKSQIEQTRLAQLRAEQLSQVVEQAPLSIIITDLDAQIEYVNPAFTQTTGYESTEVVGQNARILKSGKMEPGVYARLWEALNSGTAWRGEMHNRRKNGELFWESAVIAPLHDTTGAVTHYAAIKKDITIRKEAQEELKRANERLALATEAAGIGIWEWDIEEDRLIWDDQMYRLYGLSKEKFAGTYEAWINGIHPEDRDRSNRDLKDAIAAQKDFTSEFRVQWPNGQVRSIRAIARVQPDDDNKPLRIIGTNWDITTQKQNEEQLRSAACTDKLTGLANRAMLRDRLAQAISRAKRVEGYQFALLYLDLDRFKLINDSFGHSAGDALLVEIARRLKSATRDVDAAARGNSDSTSSRLGGDEFVILLDGIRQTEDTEIVAKRILAALAKPYSLPQGEVVPSVSIGIVTSKMAAATPEEMLRDADTAMYEAKMAGKNRYVVFDQSMRVRVTDRLEVENDLRMALERNQFFLKYQPIVSLESGKTEGFEALVRWNHAIRGLVMPSDFIPVAEETGLIQQLGQWVLFEACRQFGEWRQTSPQTAPPSISVNLSRKQLIQPGLPGMVQSILEQTHMDPQMLHLEITESAVMQDTKTSLSVLRELKQLGVKLDLDDFGTGYSSLASLHQFPLDVLKIDRAFVANLSRGRDFAALVQAVVQLARNLNISVIAEGIETSEQLQMLQALECHCGQGYLFAEALPANKVPAFSVDPAHAIMAGV